MEARTLADLINQVRHEDGVTLDQISERSDIPLSTIGAWAVGTRGARRPPAPEMLARLAVGLGRPETTVFEAAGRVHPSRLESNEAEGVYIAQLYRDLTDEDKELARDLLLQLRRRARPNVS